jgi:3-dehydroquinate synthase
MAYACNISEKMIGFKQTARVINVLQRYGLPVFAEFDKDKVFRVLKMDKKREKKQINYILLEKIGKAVITSIPLNQLEKIIRKL